VLLLAAVAGAYAFAYFYDATHPAAHQDEVGIFSAALGIAGAFLFALANRYFKLGLCCRAWPNASCSC
jgi:hypothetical protein